MRARTTVTAAAVAAVMALTVGACGGSSPKAASSTTPTTTPPSGAKVVLASIRTTAATKSAHMSMTVGTDGSGPFAFSMTAEGAVDFTTGDSQFTAKVEGAAASFLPDGIEMRMVDGVAYMKVPAALGGLLGGSGGEQWMSLSIPKGGAASGSGPLSGVDQSDPTQFLAALQKISDDVKEVGTATVRGVETTQYHATLDLGKSVDSADLPPALRDKVKGFLGNAPAIPVDVFVDSDGRVRRMTMTMDLGGFMAGVAGASGATGIGDLPTMNVTVDFYDFGVPVNVEAPPADQIISVPGFGENGGGFFGGSNGVLGVTGSRGAAA